MRMDDLLAAIEEALERKGLSAAAASSLATNNPSTIKNLRAQIEGREGKKRTGIENLLLLARVLDLEFYFGPKRAPAVQTQFQIQSIDADVSVISLSDEFSEFRPMHIALDNKWLSDNGVFPDTAQLMMMQSNIMDPTIKDGALLIIDTAQIEPIDGASDVYALRVRGSAPIVRRLTSKGKSWIVSCDNPSFAGNVDLIETPAQRLATAPIGRVVAVINPV